MARKVLISFLGTGPLESKESRVYKTAKYRLGDNELGSFPFVSAALKEYYSIDKVLLVGTVHSMWEEVYRWFSANSQKNIDDDVYLSIDDYCKEADHSSSLFLPHQAEIENAIGEGSRIVLIKYGINEKEVMDNINIILGLEQYLNEGDELIVDITHSFRSLPIFMMNLLIYLKNVSGKRINISHIHYGMLEINKELGYTPIIDLKAMMEVNEWITGAYSFSRFGNAYKISELLSEEEKSVSTLLDDFSNLMNLNHLHGIQNISQRLSSIKDKEYGTLLPQLTISPIVKKFVKRFSVQKNNHALFQVKVAKWQLEHRKYAQSLLTLNEAMITYVCEQNGLTWDDYEMREIAKSVLKNHAVPHNLSCPKELIEIYKTLRPLRNCTAHALETKKGVAFMIMTISDSLKTIESIIK